MKNEPTIRLIFFFGTFLIMALWEVIAPQTKLKFSKGVRWLNNTLLVMLNTVLARIILVYSAVQVSEMVVSKKWGLFQMLSLPETVTLVLSVIFLDWAIYTQHVIFHRIPLLWKLHRMHHADLDYDVTTGLRFHPIEILLSMLIKFAIILVLGIPPLAVILFEIILNSMAMFNHGNIRLNKTVDSVIRTLFVTPDMHRIHHSVIVKETHSNFGFNLSIWDKLFKTYIQKGEKSSEDIDIGLPAFREVEYLKIHKMLQIPFTSKEKEVGE